MLNKAIIIGNLGKDPECKTTQDGCEVARFSVATSEKWKDKASGERKEATTWHNIVVLNEGLVRVAKQYLRKGSKVYLEGQIVNRKYTSQDGIEKYISEIVMKGFGASLVMLDSKSDSEPQESYEGDQSFMDDEIAF